VKFEDPSTLSGLHRIVEIDLIEGADEPDSERDASSERPKDVAKERDALCRVQLGGGDFFFLAAHGDGRAAGSAQVADPLDVAPGGPDPAPPRDFDDGHGRSARQAALPAANGDEPVEAHRNASGQQNLGNRAPERDPRWRGCVPTNAIAHVRDSFVPRSVRRATQVTGKRART
jgi:hypothetical protein